MLSDIIEGFIILLQLFEVVMQNAVDAYNYLQDIEREEEENLRRERHQQRLAEEELVRPRRIWARQWLLRRPKLGLHERLLQELNREDRKTFRNYVRMTPELFHEMVERLTPLLQKKETNMRPPLSVALKLAVTLRFMASGCKYVDLHFAFRVSISAISRFVPVVCAAIIAVYKDEVLKLPSTPQEWKDVANDFSVKWNYHNCIGALDGTHIPIRKPIGAGIAYYNYKKFHSIILLGLVDANYKFMYAHIGAAGSAGDANTWNNCSLHESIRDGRAGLPDPQPLPNDDEDIPFHIVGDDAFALTEHLMKPYTNLGQVEHERIYSYRLSRARRIVENAFGLMQLRFRVFTNSMYLKPSKVRKIVHCGIVLHNLFLERMPLNAASREVDRETPDHHYIPGEWREHANVPRLMHAMPASQNRNPRQHAKEIRNYLARYYTSPAGSVPWQERIVYPFGRP